MNGSGLTSLSSRTLRRLYLQLFLRGRGARGLSRDGAPKSIGQKLWGVLLLYMAIGTTALAAVQPDTFMMAFYLHALGMLFTGMFIAASAGEVLFNKDEAEILGHRPVNPRQLLWAKIWVLIQVSLLMSIAYSLPGCVRAVMLGNVLFPFVHLLSMFLAAMFVAGGVVMLYQLCLRWFGRRKLDNVMTGAQVLLTVGLILGSQMARPMLTRADGLSGLKEAWWMFFVPPAWFSGLDALLTGDTDVGNVVLALLAVIAAATTGGFAFGKLADVTQEEMVHASETAPPSGKSHTHRSWPDRLSSVPPLSLLLRHPVTRASFRLCVAYMLRDRDTKLRLYPGVAPILIMPLVFLFGKVGGSNGMGISFAAAYIGLLPLLSLNLLQFSQDWQAADVLRLGPAGNPGHFVRGGLLAVCVIFVIPACVILSTAAIFLPGGWRESLLHVLPGLIALPAYTFLAGSTSKAIPLSKPTEEAKSAGRGARMMLLMLTAIIIALTSSFAENSGHLIPFLVVEGIISIVICLLANASISKAVWDPAE